MLLYDQIMIYRQNHPNRLIDVKTEHIEALRKATIIDINNVARYFYQGTGQENWDLREDFPNVAPPFESFFMEYKAPAYINSEGKLVKLPSAELRFGILFRSIRKADIWLVEAHAFESRANDFVAWLGLVKFCVDKNGAYFGKKPDDHYIVGLSTYGRTLHDAGADLAGIDGIIRVSLLAVSFMHCKNVTLDLIVPDEKLAHKSFKKSGHKSIRYHVLNIEPMRKIIDRVRESHKTDLRMSLHICRGHFKDYRRGRGLFGKFKSIYWWDENVRGSIGNGIVTKDYSISTKDVDIAVGSAMAKAGNDDQG